MISGQHRGAGYVATASSLIPTDRRQVTKPDRIKKSNIQAIILKEMAPRE